MRTAQKTNELLRSKEFKAKYRNESREYFKRIEEIESRLKSGEEILDGNGNVSIKGTQLYFEETTTYFGKEVNIGIRKGLDENDMEVQVNIMKPDVQGKKQTEIRISFLYQNISNGIIRDIEIADYSSIIMLKNWLNRLVSRRKKDLVGSKDLVGPEKNDTWEKTFERAFQKYKSLKEERRKPAENIESVSEELIAAYKRCGTEKARNKLIDENPTLLTYIDGINTLVVCHETKKEIRKLVRFPHENGKQCTNNYILFGDNLICLDCGRVVSADDIGKEQFDFLRMCLVTQGAEIHRLESTPKQTTLEQINRLDSGMKMLIVGRMLTKINQEQEKESKRDFEGFESTRKIKKEEFEIMRYQLAFLLGKKFSSLYDGAEDEDKRTALIKAYCRFTGSKDFDEGEINQQAKERLKEMMARP